MNAAPITQAASVLLTAESGSREVFLVWRSAALRFLGGFVAFPGGKVHDDDLPLVDAARGVTLQMLSAVRELFEETGVLLARRADGTFPVASVEMSRQRSALLDGEITLASLLHSHDLHIEANDLRPAGNLVTPPFAPIRFDTAFYVAAKPPGQLAEVWPGELSEGRWATATDSLDSWRRGEWLLSPPTVSILSAIRDHPIEELPERLRPLLKMLDDGRVPPIWFAPGVLMIPLDCQGIPPTTHTNTYVVGTGPRYLVDPGPSEPGEQKRLFQAIEDAGVRIDAILLTHHHPDHIGAATVSAERYGVPILAHALTAELLKGRVRVDGLIADGDRLELGDVTLTALWTPGHAPGHLALNEERLGLLLAGDMVSVLSSMIIAPKDGDLAVYLASLRRLRQVPCRLLLASHGPPTTRPTALLDEAIEHRLQRERQLIEALGAGPRSIEELQPELYRGLPAVSQPFARMQIETGLIKLRNEGRVVAEGERWRLVA